MLAEEKYEVEEVFNEHCSEYKDHPSFTPNTFQIHNAGEAKRRLFEVQIKLKLSG